MSVYYRRGVIVLDILYSQLAQVVNLHYGIIRYLNPELQ